MSVSIPLYTPISRAIGKDINLVFYLLVIAVTALVLAVKTWGLVALTMAALATVPVIFVLLLWITKP
jgi:hypothetical protein